jgi:hypothetical protein
VGSPGRSPRLCRTWGKKGVAGAGGEGCYRGTGCSEVCNNSAIANDTSGMSKGVFTDIDSRISVMLGVHRVCATAQ